MDETRHDHQPRPDAGDDSALGRALAGKYLTFCLAEEHYGVEILKVLEIIRLMPITRIPRAEPYIRGVINLRGKVIPVMDPRVKYDMGRVEDTDQTVIIVVHALIGETQLTMGILVDEVLEVMEIGADHIAPPPGLGSSDREAEFLLGVGKVEERIVFLLDITKVLSAREASSLSRATEE